ncbi:MAG TPA: selenocysteine-specific translation elongation factor [Vicinamibacterales bacterium]|nr:selenocysteine-specific translation elongation factor [Vicinamibacterales bacterium]
MNRSIVVGTAGHIDHGKSTLVRALTGTDPDRLKEERERGITIDLGFAHMPIDGVDVAFVDVPGHERFVRNMLAGAGGVDLVLLVVAADESVMPQTREHFQICRLLGVPAGLVVLTKADLADAETLELTALEVRELVQGSFLEGAPVIAVSAKSGAGLDALRAALANAAAHARRRSDTGPVRLPIDRAFSMKGFGTVATGTLSSGTIRIDQELVVLPAGRSVKVRGLQVHGRAETAVAAGTRVAVNLAGVDVAEIGRGDTLCDPGAFEPSRIIDVSLDVLAEARPLRHGARVRFHHGTTELLGRVAVSGPRAAGSDRALYARIRLERPAVVTRGDRFIIRAYSPLATVGGGVVLDPRPPRGAIRSDAGRRRFALLDITRPDRDAAATVFLADRGPAGLSFEELMRRGGMTIAAARETVSRLEAAAAATAIGDLVVETTTVTALSNALVQALQAHHNANPLSEGMPREEAREKIFRRAPAAVFEAVLQRLTAAGKIAAGQRLAIAGRQVALSADEARVSSELDRIYRDAKLTPPDLASAASAAGASQAIAERVVALLLRGRTLVKVEGLLFHASALEGLKEEIRALKKGGVNARVDVASFKERYGVTRKYAIPLLEYLDRERVTRRAGEARIVL